MGTKCEHFHKETKPIRSNEVGTSQPVHMVTVFWCDDPKSDRIKKVIGDGNPMKCEGDSDKCYLH